MNLTAIFTSDETKFNVHWEGDNIDWTQVVSYELPVALNDIMQQHKGHLVEAVLLVRRLDKTLMVLPPPAKEVPNVGRD